MGSMTSYFCYYNDGRIPGDAVAIVFIKRRGDIEVETETYKRIYSPSLEERAMYGVIIPFKNSKLNKKCFYGEACKFCIHYLSIIEYCDQCIKCRYNPFLRDNFMKRKL